MKTILLIDDDESVLSTFGLALKQHGYRVITASAGNEGMALARQHFPDLILCDVNMPDADGRTVLQSLRADPELAAKQFVLITGNTEVTPRAGMELGADDFLAKPFSAQDLVRCVNARLKRADVHWRVADHLIKELRTDLQSTLPHEFFTPLAGILGLVDVLRGDLTQLRPSELHEILDDIQRSGLRLHRTLKNYLLILDLDTAALHPPPDPLVLSADQTATFLAGALGNASKRYSRADDLTISVAPAPLYQLPRELEMIAEELVENAFSFSRKGTPVVVELTPSAMTVKDHGRGMTADEIRQIGAFRQFDRKKYEQQGLGLGLVLVQKLATRHGASFELKSRPGEGTTATISFAA